MPRNQHLPPTGIDALLQDQVLLNQLSQGTVAILTNQSALTQESLSSAQALHKKIGSALKGILVPEHGWSGLVAEGQKISNGVDPHLGVSIWSLYGDNTALLGGVETIIIDLQDVGLRCYTYSATCAQMMEALRGSNTHIIICDRPNPLGPEKKGTDLDPTYRSLVGYLDVPWQHGQTLAQLLSTFNNSLEADALPLTVMSCQPFAQAYEYPWVPPSPNLPSWEAVLLYPALVMLEGTNVSEGRGTTLPFTSLGAPGLPHHQFVDFINNSKHPGIRARPITFTPLRSKWEGQECQGAHILITDPAALNAYALGLDILKFLFQNYDNFEWIEGEHGTKYFIDSLMGTDQIRREVEGNHWSVC